MKRQLFLIIISLVLARINGQVPVSQITGIIEIDMPQDSSSIYIGAKVLDSSFLNYYRNKSNVVIGFQALDSIKASISSVIIGSQAGKEALQSESSVILGDQALFKGGNVTSSVIIGKSTATESDLINEAILIGRSAGAHSESIRNSVYIGNNAGYRTIETQDNTGVGNKSLYRGLGSGNVALGNSTGENTDASNSIFIGSNVGESSQGLSNIYIGSLSGTRSSGTSNINIGQYSGINASGDYNVYIGNRAGQEVTGNSNIILGRVHNISPINLTGKFLVNNTSGQPYIDGDRDGDTTTIFTNNFIVKSPLFDNSTERFQVIGNSSTTGQHTAGSIKLVSEGSDDGFILTDNSEPSSDLFLKSNDKVIIDLDVNDDENSSFSVRNSVGATIFNLLENGNLSVDGTLVHTSDINRKHDINAVHSNDILDKVQTLDIATWKYKGTTETHIGPMAQDFYAAFGLGVGETTIATVDADGVALAAIKALAEKNISLENQFRDQHRILQSVLKELEIIKIKLK